MSENAEESPDAAPSPKESRTSAARVHAPVRHSYDELAASYDTRWRHYIDATSALAVEALATDARGRALNIACGTGELERRLHALRPQLQLTGVDLSPNMLRQAADKQLGADWLAAVAARLPFANRSFDYVLCVNAFHYFRLPAESLAEMRRVLRPEGTLVLVDWCDDYLSCKLCSLWLRLTDRAFYRTSSLAGCRVQLEQAGLETLSAERRRISWLWGLMRFVCRAR